MPDKLDDNVPVLIVGGGLAGLTAALFLGLHGVRALLVEKHPGTTRMPKARGQYPHTMEALRVAGVADAITAASPGGKGEFHLAVAETLTGPVLRTMSHRELAMNHVSPENWAMAGQQQTEEILARRAVELGARLRFSTELIGLEQDGYGVRARVRDRDTGREGTIRAGYLVGADGRHSRVRAELEMPVHGHGFMGEVMQVFFDADMTGPLRSLPGATTGERFTLLHLRRPVPGVFYTTDVVGRYGYGRGLTPDTPDYSAFTERDCAGLVRAGLCDPDLELTVDRSVRTTLTHEIADRFTVGRVFLIGDAAKVVPAPGGLGGNTAIMDGFYLAWKLAMVVRGQAGPGLLASHDAERRPVSDMIGEQQYTNTVERLAPHLDGTQVPAIHPVTQVFGYRHTAAAVPEPDDAGELLEDPTAPTGRPGSRAPFVPLLRDGVPTSTTGLFGRSFVLLVGSEGDTWAAAARRAGARVGVDIAVHRIGAGIDDPTGAWEKTYGITPSGASLVRPDRFVAWRSAGAEGTGGLEDALRSVLDHSSLPGGVRT